MLFTTSLSYVNSCGKPLKRLRCTANQRQRDRSSPMIGKLMPFHWNQLTWSWLKPTPTGEDESEGPMEGGTIWSREPGSWGHPFLPHEEPVDRMLLSPPLKPTFPHCSYRGYSSLYGHAPKAGQVHHYGPRRTNSGREWDWGQSANCPLLAQCQTGETPLFPRTSLLDKG